ncbi:hypothetical protein L210DRAFT_2277661 [Boletus edulis BED1]|uniref:Uncharacterized protein n=1 Tax=Boletus edulis BED1 TaxID=1328754 RepID=A0AAD4BS99_BOLED|nr:hypothetical protein L210DRAFT_2277661 [Boletus edulis BED1]
MSPIPSIASTAFALSTPAPSVTLHPDSTGQSTPSMSLHLLGTGSVLVAVVALVSVARYFYHGRGTVNHTQTSNTWVSLTGLLSYIRHRCSPSTSTATATDCQWPVDVEVGIELVEVHPRMPSTPAIYVEDEANENPVPDLPGVNSVLDIDMDDDDNSDDDDSDGDDDNGTTTRDDDNGDDSDGDHDSDGVDDNRDDDNGDDSDGDHGLGWGQRLGRGQLRRGELDLGA